MYERVRERVCERVCERETSTSASSSVPVCERVCVLECEECVCVSERVREHLRQRLCALYACATSQRGEDPDPWQGYFSIDRATFCWGRPAHSPVSLRIAYMGTSLIRNTPSKDWPSTTPAPLPPPSGAHLDLGLEAHNLALSRLPSGYVCEGGAHLDLGLDFGLLNNAMLLGYGPSTSP